MIGVYRLVILHWHRSIFTASEPISDSMGFNRRMRRLAVIALFLVACATTAESASAAGTIALAWTPRWSQQVAGDWFYRVAVENPFGPETLVRYKLPTGEMQVVRKLKPAERSWQSPNFAASNDFVAFEDFERLPRRRGFWPERFTITVRNVMTGEESTVLSQVSNLHPNAEPSACVHKYSAAGVTPDGAAIVVHDSRPYRGCRRRDGRRFSAIELRRPNQPKRVLRKFTAVPSPQSGWEWTAKSNGEITRVQGRCRTGPRRHAICAVAVRLSDAAVSRRFVIDESTTQTNATWFDQFDPTDSSALLIAGMGDARSGRDPTRKYLRRWHPFADASALEDLADAPVSSNQGLVKCGSSYMVFSTFEHTYERELAGLPMTTLAPLDHPDAPVLQSSSVERDYPVLCRADYILLARYYTRLVQGSRGSGLFEGDVGPLNDWILTRD